MKKILCMLLLFVFLFGLYGCKPAEPEEKPDPQAVSDPTELIEPTVDPEPENPYAIHDFYQQRFIFKDGDDWSSIYCPNYGDNIISDQMIDWIKKVREDYNVDLIVEDGKLKELQTAVATGETYADLMSFRNYNTYNAYKAGFILPLEDIRSIDLTSGKYGPQSLLEGLTWNDDTVAFWPAYWGIDLPCFSDALMFNPRLIREYNLGDPQELYEKGQWNWDTYEEMARQMADDGSANGENPVYFSCFDTYTLRLALYSNGAELISKDPSGKLALSLDTPNAAQSIEWFTELSQISSFLEWSTDNQETNRIFYEGNMVFFPEYSVTGIKMSEGPVGMNMEEEWRYCYYPVGPSGTEADIKSGYFSDQSRFISAMAMTDEPDVLGSLMEVLFDPTFETKDGWQESFLATNFFDEFSQNYYMTKWENVRFDHASFCWIEMGDLMTSLVNMASGKDAKLSSLSAVLDQQGQSIQTLLDHAFES